jgi:hypothetical protein
MTRLTFGMRVIMYLFKCMLYSLSWCFLYFAAEWPSKGRNGMPFAASITSQINLPQLFSQAVPLPFLYLLLSYNSESDTLEIGYLENRFLPLLAVAVANCFSCLV